MHTEAAVCNGLQAITGSDVYRVELLQSALVMLLDKGCVYGVKYIIMLINHAVYCYIGR